MSLKKTLSLTSKAVKDDQVSAKRRRSDRCFSFKEISIEPGKSLKDLDSNKFKIDIKRWARAVVAYARQVSSRPMNVHTFMTPPSRGRKTEKIDVKLRECVQARQDQPRGRSEFGPSARNGGATCVQSQYLGDGVHVYKDTNRSDCFFIPFIINTIC
ncbi:hypothetical protein POTOM_001570 [Populus tomentosa]|uniref:Uncharacterized protein n=1 Tax=Populus tomentosa TaxID=118781 RepID=A0A8X8AKY0_POPTO|nr:hypothetical protein POTOM_005097 [Populus tomentosa]KAG6792422.1 hypothetical protein POTOM_001570 [Populus tomentosa]